VTDDFNQVGWEPTLQVQQLCLFMPTIISNRGASTLQGQQPLVQFGIARVVTTRKWFHQSAERQVRVVVGRGGHEKGHEGV
jgi:hypothetical protein